MNELPAIEPVPPDSPPIPPPANPPVEPEATDSPAPPPADHWIPPTREEVQRMQTQLAEQEKLLTDAKEAVSEYFDLLKEQGRIKDQPKPGASAWDADPDLKAMDHADRELTKKQLRAAWAEVGPDLLRELGVDPAAFKGVVNAEKYRAFDGERQTVRQKYGSPTVDALNTDIEKLLNERPMSYEEAFLIVKGRKDHGKAQEIARQQAAQRQQKLAAQGRPDPAAMPAPVATQPRNSAVTEVPPEKKRNLEDMILAISAKGEDVFQRTG